MDSATDNVWFEGPVAEAVAQVNARNCIFVVYVYDDTENSKKLDDTLNNEAVIKSLTSKTVALKMHTNSDNASLFKQLYPVYHVPVMYFIRQGMVKDFGAENITPEEVVAKIEQYSEIASPQPPSSSQQQHESSTVPSSTSTPPTVINAAPQEHIASTHTQTPLSSARTSSDDMDAKKERLRKQMEEARKKREEEEKKRARENEIKRRDEGKAMQQTKQELEDKQNKLYFEKLKKEKKEEEEHRRKIKEQIARDRAEQIAARQKEKQRKAAAAAAAVEDGAENVSGSKRSSTQHDSSSISIRQLDGSTMRNKFNATDTLALVKEWIDQNRTDGDRPYKLLAQFPTRQFSIGDEERTMRELDLCPSATLIMKGIKNVSNAYGMDPSYGLMDYVYSAGGVLYNAASAVGSSVSGVMHSLFPADSTSYGSAPQSSSPGSFQASSPGSGPSSHHTSAGQRLGGGSPNTRPRSNISTLRNSAFDDDDNDGRYNGNSLNQE